MSRWFRHYAGMMRDDKLVRIAIRSKQPIERVVWVWGAILESAAEFNTDGRYEMDVAEVSRFLAVDRRNVTAIVRALEDAGHTYLGVVTKWKNRQFKSDSSAKRVAKHRAANPRKATKKTLAKAGNVTSPLPKRYCNAPETETETEREERKNHVQREGLGGPSHARAREAGPFAVIRGGGQ